MKGRLFKTTIAGVALVALFATMVVAAGAAQKSVRATPSTVTITGTVTGIGGTGSRAWSQPVSGAIISVQGAAETAATAANGAYSLIATFSAAAYSGKAITATRAPWYSTGTKLLGDGNPQVQTFRLTVKGTKFTVTVKSGSQRIEGATVACFGQSAATNGNGVATLSGLQLKPRTAYTVRITKPGYRATSFQAESSPGGTVRFTQSITKM